MVVTNINSLNVIAAAPQQTKIPETGDGFSETFDSVNKSSKGSSFKTEDTYSYTKQAGEALNETDMADVGVDTDTDLSYSEVSSTEVISVVEKAMEMLKVEIESDSGNEEMSEDDILDMLIKIIDKMQEDEDGTTCDAAIEMLLAILGTESFRSEPKSIEITAVTGEISEISFEVSETVIVSEPVMTEERIAPMQTTEAQAEVPETAESAEAPVFTAEVAEIMVEQETVKATENAPEAPETAETQTEAQPAAEIDKLLSDILEKAKKELGLTEVKLTNNAPTEEAEAQADIAPKQEMPMNISRSDRTDELRTILGEDNSAENTQTKTETGNAVHMAQNLVEGRMTAEIRNTEVLQPEAQTVVSSPEIQAGEQILARMESLSNGETEFTMVLNPESLGKITVKLLTVGERVAVEITAEKASTQQLLDARGESLQNMLRDNGVQLERYQVVAESDNAELMQESYDGSSRNPYFREEENNSEENDGENSFYELLQSL